MVGPFVVVGAFEVLLDAGFLVSTPLLSISYSLGLKRGIPLVEET
jgi:hypothetical protein